MFRPIAVLVASLITAACATGCQNASPAEPADGLWSAPVTTDDQGWNLMRRIREIDPCALIPRSALDEHATVREVHIGADLPTSCTAVLDTGGQRPVEVHWSLARAPLGSAVEESRRVGEVPVEVLDPEGAEPPGARGRCWVTAQFPSMTQIFLTVNAETGTDACGLGNALIDEAIAQLPTSPAYGTSPDSVRTALTGADPCEILPGIGATPLLPVADFQVVHSCRFGAAAEKTTAIDYGYQHANEIPRAETVTVNGRELFVSRVIDGGHIGYTFVAGPAVTGDLVPTVTVFGLDHTEVERARDALMVRFPAP